MCRKILSLALVLVMVFSLSVPAFANDAQPLDDSHKETLRGYVAGNTQLLGSIGGYLGDLMKPLIRTVINDYLKPADLAGIAAPMLSDLIKNSLNDAGISIPESVNIESIVTDVFANEIITGILGSDFVAKIIDKVIDGLMEEIDLRVAMPVMTNSMVNAIVDDIWNDGFPVATNILRQPLWTGTNWNATRISSYILLTVMPNIGNYMDASAIDLAALLPSNDILLGIFVGAVKEVATEYYETYKSILIARVQAKIDEYKAAAKVEFVKELNKIFGTTLPADMSLREIEAALTPIIDKLTYENKSVIIGKLTAAKKLALIISNEDLVACINRLIACVEASNYCEKYDHEWIKGIVTEPTCTSKGFTTYTCSICGDTKKDDEVAATGHKWSLMAIAHKAPTCTENGFNRYSCTNGCGEFNNVVITKLGHDWEWVVKIAPTCDKPGQEVQACKNGCGAPSMAARTIAALGHDYIGVVTQPTTSEKGYTTYTCKICGHSYKGDYTPSIVDPSIKSATAKFVSIDPSSNKTVYELKFSVTFNYSDGTSKVTTYSIYLNGNNANQSGKYKFEAGHDLAGYTLNYDIKGNGSNIKDFKLVKN